MQDSALEHIRQILPELFETNLQARKPGGMCTPGSGCPPAMEGAGPDIIGMLVGSDRPLPGRVPGAGEKELPHKASDAADLENVERRPA